MKLYVQIFIVVMMVILCTACYEDWDNFQGGCDESSEETADSEDDFDRRVELPPANMPFDYQIGGAYAPPDGVKVISRDRNDRPAAMLYNICYINGFQVQPDEEDLWPDDLVLRDKNGRPVIDSGWDEMLLDISTDDKRKRIAAIVGKWIEDGAVAGYNAVEIDNLDSYTRSGNRLKKEHAVAMMALLSAIAHDNRLAVAQKNSAELLKYRDRMGTDFAVAEECSRYNECEDYLDSYGEKVLMIEYRAADFLKGCKEYGKTHSIVLRDLFLRLPRSSKYLFDGC